MPKLRSVIGGMVGTMALFSVSTGQAQERGCTSGLICMFTQHPAAPSAPMPQPTSVAAVPAAAAAPAEASMAPKPRLRIAHPARTVIIAADLAEAGRLKDLAAAMPKEHIRIVKTSSDAVAADFAVSTTLETRPGAEKAKLFTEQMHVLAGPKVASLADLSGKVVSFGVDKSASQAAGRKAFEALGIAVKETPLDLDNALDGLSTGDIDAVVVLAPQPDTRLAKLSGGGLHLVAWPQNGTLPDGAVASSIEAASYPRLATAGETIPALGVDAVLTLSPRGERQPAAKSFLTALSQHSAALSKRGFDLLKADLDVRADRRVADVGAR